MATLPLNKREYVYILREFDMMGQYFEGIFTTLHRAKIERPGQWVKSPHGHMWSHDTYYIHRIDLNVHYS